VSRFPKVLRGQRLILACALTLAVTAAGVAVAAIPSGGTFNGCYTNVGGVLRVIDLAKGQSCARFETAVTWNQQGAPGLAGKDGAPGAEGAPGAPGIKGAPGADAVSALTGRIDDTPSSPAGFAYPEGQSDTLVLAAAEDQVAFRSPNVALVARDLSVAVGAAGPGFIEGIPFGWRLTLRDDAADTAVSCTVSGDATSCHSDAATALIAAGSDLTLKFTRVCVPTPPNGQKCPQGTTLRFGWRAVTAP
jgi:hypothetical protein